MDELINVLSQRFQEILGLIQAWWIPIGAFAGSFWLIIKKIWPWSKGLWDAREKLKQLQNEQKNVNLREEVILVKEENFKLKEEVTRLSNQLEIKENVVWKDGILYYGGAEICSRCYDTSTSTDRKTVRLLTSDHEIKGIFYCPECKTHSKTTEGALQQRDKHREAIRQLTERRY